MVASADDARSTARYGEENGNADRVLDEFSLGPHFEARIRGQLATGIYADASEVVRNALGLFERREGGMHDIDRSISCGLADTEAGRMHDLDTVFDGIEAELASPSHTVG